MGGRQANASAWWRAGLAWGAQGKHEGKASRSPRAWHSLLTCQSAAPPAGSLGAAAASTAAAAPDTLLSQQGTHLCPMMSSSSSVSTRRRRWAGNPMPASVELLLSCCCCEGAASSVPRAGACATSCVGELQPARASSSLESLALFRGRCSSMAPVTGKGVEGRRPVSTGGTQAGAGGLAGREAGAGPPLLRHAPQLQSGSKLAALPRFLGARACKSRPMVAMWRPCPPRHGNHASLVAQNAGSSPVHFSSRPWAGARLTWGP